MSWLRARIADLINQLPRRPIGEALELVRAHLATGLVWGIVLGIVWVLLGIGLAGRRLVLWLLVPALAAAALACILGPDRLFPKRPYEGPSLLVLSENHAITLLDVPGVLCAGVALILAGWLIRDRWRRRGPRRARRSAAR